MKSLIQVIALFIIFSFTVQDVFAQTKLSVQGVIRKSDGNAVEDGEYAVTFNLYDTLASGNLLWSETQAQLNVTSGIYSTILGEVTPLDLPFDQFYFLSLTIDGEELLPRAPLTSSPYANALIGFDNAFPSSGNVGIGTLNPSKKLDVQGKMNVSDTLFADDIHYTGTIYSPNDDDRFKFSGKYIEIDNPTPTGEPSYIQFTNTNGTPPGGRFEIGVNALWEAEIRNFNNNTIRFITGSTERMRLTNGWLAIGTSNPSHILHVNGVCRSNQSTWATSSDGRVKRNIQELEDGAISKIMQLRPVHYDWNEEYKKEVDGLKDLNTGFIAQEIEQIFPEMITTVEESFGETTIEDFRVLSLGELPVYLVKAMQEQQEQINLLVSQNEALQKELKTQEEKADARLSTLVAKINNIIEKQSLTKL